MKVFFTHQIRQADAFTIEHEPIASVDLMARAAQRLFEELKKRLGIEKKLCILAGHGNNGGDGVVLSRLWVEAGGNVDLHIMFSYEKWSADTRTQFDRLPASPSLRISTVEGEASLTSINAGDVVVDALLGTGLSREPDGLYASAIQWINDSNAAIVSIDIPSGLFGEDNRLNSYTKVVRADLTLTFQFPKLAMFFSENQPFVGEWKVLPIGLHRQYIEETATTWNYLVAEDIKPLLPRRNRFSHKGDFGHALLISGMEGKAGAAVLAAEACARTGSGLVTIHVPGNLLSIIQTAVPEAMASLDPNPKIWTTVPDPSNYSAVGIGPGIGTEKPTADAFLSLLDRYNGPLILDADAINIISLNPGVLKKIPQNSILTPHPGEFKRLFGEDPDDFSRVQRMQTMAKTYKLIIVCKGAFTQIACPDGSVWFNTTGNPGMATGGSGDVLTGMITSLLAQGLNPPDAAKVGVFLHGLAGDMAAQSVGEMSLIARDIIRNIGNAIKQLIT